MVAFQQNLATAAGTHHLVAKSFEARSWIRTSQAEDQADGE